MDLNNSVIALTGKYIIKDLNGLIRQYYDQHGKILKVGQYGQWNDHLMKKTKKHELLFQNAYIGEHLDMIRHTIKHTSQNSRKEVLNCIRHAMLRRNERMLKLLLKSSGLLKERANNVFLNYAGQTSLSFLKWLFSKAYDNIRYNFNNGMAKAAFGGNLKVFRFLVKKGANCWNDAFIEACRGGQLEMVKYMLNKTPFPNHLHITIGIKRALENKYDHISEYLLKTHLKYISNIDGVLESSAEYGNLKIARLSIEHGARDWNQALIEACRKENIEMVKFLIEMGGDISLVNRQYGMSDKVKRYIEQNEV